MPHYRKIVNPSLIGVFALVATVFMGVRISNPSYKAPAGPVALTPGEKALTGIFGSEVNSGIVRKIYDPAYEGMTAASVSNDTDIRFRPHYHAPDYSRAEASLYGTFLHEMTHIWQRQAHVATPAVCDEAGYSLSEGRAFGTYCREQQAMIVEDYARRFLYPGKKPATEWNVKQPGLAGFFSRRDTPETDALLQKTVEDRFPQARVMRQAHKPKAPG